MAHIGILLQRAAHCKQQKNIKMKQLLFLLFFPCLALAQYTGNAGQKITLGEQTTADGLVWRGVASIDTVTATSKITRANKQDTSAFILLDTVTNLLWHYKIGSNGWIQAGGSTLDTATMLLPYYRAGKNDIIQAANVPTLNQNTTGSAATLTTGRTIQTNLASTSAATFNGSANITPGVTGILPVANGGTGKSALTANKVLVGNGTDTVNSPTNLHWRRYSSHEGLGIGTGANTDPVGNGVNHLSVMGGSYPGAYAMVQLMAPSVDAEGQLYGVLAFTDQATANNAAQMRSQRGPVIYSGNYSFFTSPGTTINNAVRRMQVKHDGKIGIGEIDATELLDVDGNARIRGLNGIGDIGADANGVLQAASSDMNLKNTIENSPFGLNEILLLNPVTFLYNDENRKIDSDVKEVGFIAQDVFDIIPNAVSSTGAGDLQLDYRAITATLVKAIQEQQTLIKALEQRILILENK